MILQVHKTIEYKSYSAHIKCEHYYPSPLVVWLFFFFLYLVLVQMRAQCMQRFSSSFKLRYHIFSLFFTVLFRQ